MRQIVHGKNIEVTPALGDYAKSKLGKVNGWTDDEADLHITLSVEGHKHEHTVEVTTLVHGVTLRVEVKQDDMYAAIDLAADKLERRFRKLQDKLLSRLRKQGMNKLHSFEPETDREADGQSTEYQEEDEFPIVRTKNIQLKPVDLQEAILHMKLLDHDFHLFYNRDSEQTELVYKRKDGSFGHITSA